MAEKDMWENRENLENAKELVEEFEREYREKAIKLRWQELEEEEKEFSWELSCKFTSKLLYRWRKKNIRKKGRRDKRKIENNRKIP